MMKYLLPKSLMRKSSAGSSQSSIHDVRETDWSTSSTGRATHDELEPSLLTMNILTVELPEVEVIPIFASSGC